MVRFNFDRFLGILAVGAVAFLLVAMTHVDPSHFIQYIISYQNQLLWLYVVSLLVAAAFLSFERG